jgi:hypothetical protein
VVFDGILNRLIPVVSRVRDRYRHAALGIAVVLFIVGGLAAIQRVDVDLKGSAWPILAAVALLGVPPMMLLNAAEVRAAARLSSNVELDWRIAIEVAVTGTAANLLPIPGATLVRIDAMAAAGASTSDAVRSNVAVGAIWVAVSAAISAAILTGFSIVAAIIALSVALAAGFLAKVALRNKHDWSRLGMVLAIEVASLGLTAARLWAIGSALGTNIGGQQAIVIAASYAVTSAVGIFPGGLGLREGLSSGLALVVGLPGSTGFVASAVDRLLGFAIHLPMTAALAARRR